MIGEKSQTQKEKCHMFSLICGNQYANPTAGNEMLVTRGDLSWSTLTFR